MTGSTDLGLPLASAPRRRPAAVLATLAALAVFALLLAVSIGTAGPGPGAVWRELLAGSDPLVEALVLDLRLPRALNAFGAGAALALAGVCMQVLLRNPLADPYVLGVSGGAAVAALGAMLLGLGMLAVQVGAIGGALAATLLVFTLARGSDLGAGAWTPSRLLLTGVVLAAGFGALVSLLLALGDATQLRGMLFWLMGDLSFAGAPWALLGVALLAVPLGLAFARPLNVLSRGELQAELLGVPTRALRIGLYVAASVLTAVTVTSVGTIGFVGLVTPHLVRLALGADHRWVIPAAALAGGTLVVVADLLARTAFAPRMLPVGALTALVGVPLFLALMRRTRAAG
ncbi:MAG: iron ABC transporter permease [Steroidobacteraceae bacterium]|jgi:iron complex transport system permease protein|nr:iron ABC transporter permease [Steroidobacteraceae bacterium]